MRLYLFVPTIGGCDVGVPAKSPGIEFDQENVLHVLYCIGHVHQLADERLSNCRVDDFSACGARGSLNVKGVERNQIPVALDSVS